MNNKVTCSPITAFQLISAIHAIGLEAKGMRHSKLHRQGGVKGLWAKHYGMPKGTKAEVVIAKMREHLATLEKQQELPL